MLRIISSFRCKSNFIAREIIYRNFASAWYKESFQYRILDYFESALKNKNFAKKIDIHDRQMPNIRPKFSDNDHKSSDVQNDTKQNSVDTNFFHDCITEISNTPDQLVRREILDELDMKCCSLLDSLSNSDILKLLNEFLKAVHNEFVKLYFYDRAMITLFRAAETGSLSNHEMIQLLYFISLKKDNGSTYINSLMPYLPDINDLPLIEKCIAAQSFYSSSIKLPSRQLKLLEKVIQEEFDQLIQDPHLLTSLCKVIIVSEPSNEFSLEKLSKRIVSSKEPLDFKMQTIILSLYAEALLFEPEAIDHLVKDCINLIREDTVSKKFDLNLRNIDTFLWSVCTLGITLTLHEKVALRMCIENRFSEYKQKENLGILVNSILSLHMLRSWSMKILKNCLQERLLEQVFNRSVFWKTQARLQLLISQIDLEMKFNLPGPLKRTVYIGYSPSENVRTVEKVASSLVYEGIATRVQVECPIHSLIIPGVTIRTENNIFHVDVLDNSTCLRRTHIPHGLMNLKLRLLSRLRYRQILINGDVFKETPQKARSSIEKKIKNSINYGKASFLSENKSERSKKFNLLF